VRTIIAGGRADARTGLVYGRTPTEIDALLETAIATSRFTISSVIGGMATGVDAAGERYARRRDLPFTPMPADWTRYGRGAGPVRNEAMAVEAGAGGALIAIHDGKSRGTADMIRRAERHGLRLYVETLDPKK